MRIRYQSLRLSDLGSKTFAVSVSGNAKVLDDFTTSFYQAIENIASLRAQNGGSMSRLDFAMTNLDRTGQTLKRRMDRSWMLI